ncbi:MAG: DUF1015 family protein, partial [Clostridia bacterium]|nr:DUF1015 family protein [Clostridia bacterium]
MATLKPFKALRYNKERVGKIDNILCPPYDIIPNEKLASYMEKSEFNIIHLERPIGDNPYEKAAQTLKYFLDEKALVHESENSMYIYEEEFEIDGEVKSFKGLISGVKLEEFSKKIVLPHEETLSKAKEDRLNLM